MGEESEERHNSKLEEEEDGHNWSSMAPLVSVEEEVGAVEVKQVPEEAHNLVMEQAAEDDEVLE